jgi:hypothetical protein
MGEKLTEPRKVYFNEIGLYTHTHTHTHIYIYIYIHIFQGLTICIRRSPQWLFRVENTYQLHIQVSWDIQRIYYSHERYSILIAQRSLNNTGDQLFMIKAVIL